MLCIRACLRIPSLSPCPSKFIIVSMETDRLMERMGMEPILSNRPSPYTPCKFDEDGDGHRHGDTTRKQALNKSLQLSYIAFMTHI